MTDRYAVVGNPVAHSLSPRIHQAFAAATGQHLVYERLEAPLDGFEATVQAFFSNGGAGVNVTVPFKEQAAAWVDELDEPARAAGAVNTVCRSGSSYRGFNTDGAGLVRDLTVNLGVCVAGRRVLLLGAGGAARGVLRPLLRAGVEMLVIANRSPARAHTLAEAVQRDLPGSRVRARSFASLETGFDLVINATSAGLGGEPGVPDIAAGCVAGAFCYDMMYSRSPDTATAFCLWAGSHGAAGTADGLGMLVEQAALAFELWRGVAPATAPVLELLRRERV